MKIVVTTVVINDDKVLLLQRSNLGSSPGKWNFPGGKFDPEDESLKAAAARETKEESDLDVHNLEFMGKISYSKIELYVFYTDEFDGEVKINEESDDFKWVSLDEIGSFVFPGGTKLNENIMRELEYIIGD